MKNILTISLIILLLQSICAAQPVGDLATALISSKHDSCRSNSKSILAFMGVYDDKFTDNGKRIRRLAGIIDLSFSYLGFSNEESEAIQESVREQLVKSTSDNCVAAGSI